LPFAPFRLLFRLRAALGLACSRFADAALDDALSPLLQFRFRAALDLAPSSFADAALDDSECSTSSRLRYALNLAPLDPLFFAAAVDDRVRTPPIVNTTSERNTKGGNIDAVQHNYGRIMAELLRVEHHTLLPALKLRRKIESTTQMYLHHARGVLAYTQDTRSSRLLGYTHTTVTGRTAILYFIMVQLLHT
jgi:hypothetical protein